MNTNILIDIKPKCKRGLIRTQEKPNWSCSAQVDFLYIWRECSGEGVVMRDRLFRSPVSAKFRVLHWEGGLATEHWGKAEPFQVDSPPTPTPPPT